MYLYYCRTAAVAVIVPTTLPSIPGIHKQQPMPSCISWQQCRIPGSMQFLLAQHLHLLSATCSGARHHRLLEKVPQARLCSVFYLPFHSWKEKRRSHSRLTVPCPCRRYIMILQTAIPVVRSVRTLNQQAVSAKSIITNNTTHLRIRHRFVDDTKTINA